MLEAENADTPFLLGLRLSVGSLRTAADLHIDTGFSVSAGHPGSTAPLRTG